MCDYWKKIDGIIHFAIQAKLECGNFDIIEFAPTVQILTSDITEIDSNITPFLNYVFNVNESRLLVKYFSQRWRFYKEQNKNMIIIDDNLDDKLPENYIWMSLNQLQKFVDLIII